MKAQLKVLPLLILGNAMLAFAVCAFVVPYGIMLGGSSGIALTVKHFLPGLRLSVITAAVNISLFLLGWAFLGKKFAATSLISTIIYPIELAIFESLPLGDLFQEEVLVVGLFCGLLIGLGIGLVVRTGGSTGGMDIPPCILQKYLGIPVGTSLMVFDTAIVLMQVSFQGLRGVLLSILVIMVTSVAINRTLVSGEKKVQITIISPAYQQIRQEILDTMDCGLTLLDIETGYAGQDQKAILSVVYARKYPAIRDAALKIDPHAFIVANDVTNVNGRGYTISRHSE
ncbi:MAG: YitT family protein [Oscillospiraceae bacterium]|nr:YitT family protein [Oscillospiraceae bacterium]